MLTSSILALHDFIKLFFSIDINYFLILDSQIQTQRSIYELYVLLGSYTFFIIKKKGKEKKKNNINLFLKTNSYLQIWACSNQKRSHMWNLVGEINFWTTVGGKSNLVCHQIVVIDRNSDMWRIHLYRKQKMWFMKYPMIRMGNS